MAIDFKKKLASRTITPKTNPIELYGTLDRKSVAGPLRPAQEIVLSEWYTKRRADKDLIIKLHTGEGIATSSIFTQFKGGAMSLYMS